jgi:hypothetical protein
MVCGQPCAPGTVKRLKQIDTPAGEEKPYCPPPVMNSKYPDGFPDLSPTLARELHNTKRIASRVTALAQKIRQFGGWLIFECPSTRGNKQRLGLYDPAFDLHSGVMGLEYYREIIDKGATIVHAHMCKLREGYPQKPEDYIISDNIVLGLGEALNSLRCTHPFGTHNH